MWLILSILEENMKIYMDVLYIYVYFVESLSSCTAFGNDDGCFRVFISFVLLSAPCPKCILPRPSPFPLRFQVPPDGENTERNRSRIGPDRSRVPPGRGEAENGTGIYFRPKSAGISPHCLVSHFRMGVV